MKQANHQETHKKTEETPSNHIRSNLNDKRDKRTKQ
jgi:hypothetical protein